MYFKNNWGYKLTILFLVIVLIVTTLFYYNKTVKIEDFKALEKALNTLENRVTALEERPPTSGIEGNPKEGYQFNGNPKEGY
ncbi:hypothetical protein ACFLVN_04840 [Chloroflexota bacterium]